MPSPTRTSRLEAEKRWAQALLAPVKLDGQELVLGGISQTVLDLQTVLMEMANGGGRQWPRTLKGLTKKLLSQSKALDARVRTRQRDVRMAVADELRGRQGAT